MLGMDILSRLLQYQKKTFMGKKTPQDIDVILDFPTMFISLVIYELHCENTHTHIMHLGMYAFPLILAVVADVSVCVKLLDI